MTFKKTIPVNVNGSLKSNMISFNKVCGNVLFVGEKNCQKIINLHISCIKIIILQPTRQKMDRKKILRMLHKKFTKFT